MSEARTHAINLYNQGVALVTQADEAGPRGDKSLAYRMFMSAVDTDPALKEAWFALAKLGSEQGWLGSAACCMARVVEIDPTDAKAHVDLGHKLYHLGKIAEAKRYTEIATRLDPELAHGWGNLSLIESVLGNDRKACQLALKAHEIDPEDPTIAIQVGFSHLFAGEYKKGFEFFEWRFKYKLTPYLSYPYEAWDGSVTDKTVLLPADQGMGDVLCFSRFLPAVAAKVGKGILLVHAELVRFLRATLQDYSNLEVQPLTPHLPEADLWCSIASLPQRLALTDKEIVDAPWLPVPGFKLPPSWKVPDKKLHIGIAWDGAALNEINHWRRMDVTNFLDIARVAGVQLYSLQFGPDMGSVHTTGAASVIRDLSPHIRDVADTMAILRDLDMVISIETSLGWMAAALGMECWIMYARNGGDWRMGRTRTSPLWAPRTRIFKQGSDAQWQPVIDRVVTALTQKVASVGQFKRQREKVSS